MLNEPEKSAIVVFNWHPSSSIKNWPEAATRDSENVSVSDMNDGVRFINDTPIYTALAQLREAINSYTQQPECRDEFCMVTTSDIDSDALVTKPSSTLSNSKYTTEDAARYFQCMSSGTGGAPKRVRRSHESWLLSFKQNAHRATITDNDSYALVGKLSHSLALYAALEAAHIGADIHALSELRPDAQAKALYELGSTILYATPTQLRLIAHQAQRLNITQFKLRHIFCGGGKLDQRTANMLAKVFPTSNVQEFYGATETSFITLSDKHTPLGSVGKPYTGVKVRIHPVNAEHDRVDENRYSPGEIHVQSPYLFHGYVGETKNDARWHDGYVTLGETGYIDDNGYLFLSGRDSRRVNIADQLVYPEEIEAIINEHPDVHACAVVAIADEKRGQVLAAIVETENANELEQSLLHELRQQVGSLKAPRTLLCVDQLPLLASGKPDLNAAAALLHCS